MVQPRSGDEPTAIFVNSSREVMRALSEYLESEAQLSILITATDAEAGVAAAKSVDADIVLLGINMPGMDPWNACTEIIENTNSKVLFYTAMHSDAYVDLCRNAGGSGIVSKKEPFETVGDAVRTALRGGEYFSSIFYPRYRELNEGAEIAPAAKLDKLERTVLRLLVEGRTPQEMGKMLGYSYDYIQLIVYQMRLKVNADNDAELGAWALKEKLVPPEILCR